MATPEQTIALALELAHQGRSDEGIATVRRALQRQPNNLMLSAGLGQLLMQSGQMDRALFQFRRCVDAAPRPAHQNNLGMILCNMGRNAEAVAAFREAVRLDPGYAKGWIGLSLGLLQIPDYEGAAGAARRAIELEERHPEAHLNLALGLLESGQVEESIAAMRRGLAIASDHGALRSTMLIALNYREALSPQELRREHEEFGRVHGPAIGTSPARTSPDPERRLKIGVLSADMRGHSVMYFFEPLLEHHDRAGFEFTCFSTSSKSDDTTRRLKAAADAWVDAAVPDAAIVDRMIRERKIDILIELGGHSGANKLLCVTGKPAPIIVTALGYPNTTGIPAVDYRIVDSLTDPPGSEDHATERLVRIDPCFLCYRPHESPEPAPVPEGPGVVFGSFNSLQKLSPETLLSWSALLARVPGSRLALKTGGLENPWARRQITDRLVAAGVPAERLELIAPTKGIPEHLETYGRIHIGLDPFPYNGTTTTCEAMWMGVPVVALAGGRHASRVGVSLLSAVGLPDLIAPNRDEYVRIAADLAADRGRLEFLRRGLRPMMKSSVLCDGPAYARRFEAALRGMWRDWCARQPRA